MVGSYATGHCVSVHLVVEDFGLAGLPRHCWEDLVVDHLLVVDYCLGSGVSCFWIALVGYWGLAGWDSFAMQTPVLKVLEEWGWGLERLAWVVHSRLGGVEVLQMWESIPTIFVSAN